MWLDEDRWHEHLRTVAGASPGLVPVAKGNGYGFGLGRLATEAGGLGVDTLAVGIPAEVARVRDAFAGDIVILQPFDGDDALAAELAGDPRVITTVSRIADLARITELGGRPRVLGEVLTSMRRHGLPSERVSALLGFTDRLQLEGWTIHLP